MAHATFTAGIIERPQVSAFEQTCTLSACCHVNIQHTTLTAHSLWRRAGPTSYFHYERKELPLGSALD